MITNNLSSEELATAALRYVHGIEDGFIRYIDQDCVTALIRALTNRLLVEVDRVELLECAIEGIKQKLEEAS